MADNDSPAIAAALAAAARTMHSRVDLDETLQIIVETALDTIPGFDHVGISTKDKHGHITTRAATGDLVHKLDDLQYSLREGPCYETLSGANRVTAPDMRHQQRWPRFVPAALPLGLRSQMAVQLHLDDEGTIGGLNLYSTSRDEVDPEAGPLADLFAAHAAIALSSAARTHGLNEALFSRKLIGQALGILMERYNLNDDQAFAYLLRVSSRSNVKLREVARHLVEEKNVDASAALQSSS